MVGDEERGDGTLSGRRLRCTTRECRVPQTSLPGECSRDGSSSSRHLPLAASSTLVRACERPANRGPVICIASHCATQWSARRIELVQSHGAPTRPGEHASLRTTKETKKRFVTTLSPGPASWLVVPSLVSSLPYWNHRPVDPVCPVKPMMCRLFRLVYSN